jgi:hypothetical protein
MVHSLSQDGVLGNGNDIYHTHKKSIPSKTISFKNFVHLSSLYENLKTFAKIVLPYMMSSYCTSFEKSLVLTVIPPLSFVPLHGSVLDVILYFMDKASQ